MAVDDADAEDVGDPRRVEVSGIRRPAAEMGEERRRGAEEACGGEEGP